MGPMWNKRRRKARLAESEQAVEEAKRRLSTARDRWEPVKAVAESLAARREVNNISPGLDALFAQRRRGQGQ